MKHIVPTFEDFRTDEMSPDKRKYIDLLKNSLAKKEDMFNVKLQAYFDDVKSANGQPLNDKRNGQATINRWSKQNDMLSRLQAEIQKTKDAIEREEGKIRNVDDINSKLPSEIISLLNNGQLNQWRKYPNFFFIPEIEHGRLVWDMKDKKLYTKYFNDIPTDEQKDKFKNVAVQLDNSIKSRMELEKSSTDDLPTEEQPQNKTVSAKLVKLKAAPANYTNGGYHVFTKIRDKFKEEVSKLADITTDTPSSVETIRGGKTTMVTRTGDNYMIDTVYPDGRTSKEEYNKGDFERKMHQLV